jgi:hypothetical protein
MSSVSIDEVRADVVPEEGRAPAPTAPPAASPPPGRDPRALERARDAARLLRERELRQRVT